MHQYWYGLRKRGKANRAAEKASSIWIALGVVAALFYLIY